MSDSPDQAEAAAKHRPIRSFVLRQGRQTEAQKRAFDLHWPALGLHYRGEPRDYDAVFGRHAPRVVEIGFGNGEQLLFAAARETGRDFIGIELSEEYFAIAQERIERERRAIEPEPVA